MKSIGGYFQLELHKAGEYHKDLIRLNTARNALEYILKVQNFKKVYIPYFTCDVILESFTKANTIFDFYYIDANFEPVFDFNLIGSSEAFLYTNYFGIKDLYIKKLSQKVTHLIIDNAQSFFSESLEKVHTIYSPRKFFGVSDGAYLSTTKFLEEDIETDFSYERMSHLLIRADKSAEEGYADFCRNDAVLINNKIKIMSHLTRKILCSIDYENVMKIRRTNFDFLHLHLKDKNKLSFSMDVNSIPLVYPFWSEIKDLKKGLVNNKIYTATYWPNVLEWCENIDLEYKLSAEVIYLPIDQRYSESDMEFIVEKIMNISNA